jgi:hypothetical protein
VFLTKKSALPSNAPRNTEQERGIVDPWGPYGSWRRNHRDCGARVVVHDDDGLPGQDSQPGRAQQPTSSLPSHRILCRAGTPASVLFSVYISLSLKQFKAKALSMRFGVRSIFVVATVCWSRPCAAFVVLSLSSFPETFDLDIPFPGG